VVSANEEEEDPLEERVVSWLDAVAEHAEQVPVPRGGDGVLTKPKAVDENLRLLFEAERNTHSSEPKIATSSNLLRAGLTLW